jgi:hypothetical protein
LDKMELLDHQGKHMEAAVVFREWIEEGLKKMGSTSDPLPAEYRPSPVLLYQYVTMVIQR